MLDAKNVMAVKPFLCSFSVGSTWFRYWQRVLGSIFLYRDFYNFSGINSTVQLKGR